MLLEKTQNCTRYLLIFLLVSFHISYGIEKDIDSLSYYKQQLLMVDELPIERSLYLFSKTKQFASDEEVIYFTREEADLLTEKGLKELSYSTHIRSLELARESNFKILEGLIHQDLCLHYYKFNQNKLAYKTMLEAKTILENATPSDFIIFNKDRENKATKEEIMDDIMYNLGALSVDNKEFDKAQKHFTQSLVFFVKRNDKQGVFYAKLALANLLLEKGEYQQSNISFFELLKDSIKLKEDLSLIHYNISWNFLELKRYSQALEHVDNAISISTEIEDFIQLIDLNFLKARVLVGLRDYRGARLSLDYTLQKSIEIDDLPFLIDVYKQFVDVEEKDNNLIKANFYYKELLIIQDSLKQRKEQDTYNEILLKNKLQNQEQLNTKQQIIIEKEQWKSKTYFTIIVLGIFFISALILAYYYSRASSKKKVLLLENEARIKEIEFENKQKDELIKSNKIKNELKQKKSELLLSLLYSKKRKERAKKIEGEIDKISGKSIITKTDLFLLKKFIAKQSNELDKEQKIQEQINEAQKVFFTTIHKAFPDLTKTDLKILAFIRVDLNTKEIAEIQGVSIDAVRKSRYRIRKKLKLSPKESLEKFIFDYH